MNIKKNKVVYPQLSYTITGLCFQVHKEMGRFAKEKQYGDKLENLLKQQGIKYVREIDIQKFNPNSMAGNKADFLVEEKVVIELKAKKFVTKEDYIQTQRYLQSADLELGLIVNFRNTYIKPKRVLNPRYSGYSDVHSGNSGNSDRSLYHSHRPNGYIALITVLIIGAVGTAAAVSVILLGLGSSRTSFALEQSNQTKALANACAEEALQQIRDSVTFTGTGNLSLGQGTCTYTVTNDGAQNRTITASGTVGTMIRKVKITLDQINPTINLTSWQEVADF